MQKLNRLVLLVLAIFLLLPTAAWAAEVPNVTEDEYRFYLESMGDKYLHKTDFSQYSDAELRAEIVDLLDRYKIYGDGGYRDMLRVFLRDDCGMDETQTYRYTTEELELFYARSCIDRMYEWHNQLLKESCQIEVNPVDYPPKEFIVFYCEHYWKQEYGIEEDLSGENWILLKEKDSVLREIGKNQDKIGRKENLSGYSMEELKEYRDKIYIEWLLQDKYGESGDLSGYSKDELEDILEGHVKKKFEKERQEAEAALQAEAEKIKIQINGQKMIYANEKGYDTAKYKSDVKPIMQENRVYIPFRAVFEALDADVSYNAATKTVTAKRDNTTVSFTVGEAQYSKNGTTQQMDAKVFVQDGRTFVPVRFAAQALGATVEWDSESRTVVITE